MSEITENDVRLLRRIMVARLFRDYVGAVRIIDYLRNKREINFILPEEVDDPQTIEAYLNIKEPNERWLARKWGCILLPEYKEAIFLNSKWPRPRTIYVRLVHPVPELDEYGQIYWLPESQMEKYEGLAEQNHKLYSEYKASLERKNESFWKRLFGGK